MKGIIISLFVILIFIAVFSVYFNSFRNEFVWDDEDLIYKNERMHDWRYLAENFKVHLYHGTGDASNFYRPILAASFMLDYSIWKDDVFGWHLTNVLLHTINAVLVFLVFGLILKDRLASFIAAMLFAVHPLFTSAVTYISGRGDPLALFFMLGAFLFFIKSQQILSIIFFILALLTKETAIILPLLLYAYDRSLRGAPAKAGATKQSQSARVKSEIASAASRPRNEGRKFYPYIAVCAAYGILRATVLKFPFVPTLTTGSTLYLRLLTMAKILWIYLGLLIFPMGLHMERNIRYVKTFFEPQVVVSIAALIITAYFIWKKIYKKDKAIFFGILWFLIALLPVSNIMPLNMSMAEHWMYVPAIGIFACAGVVFSRLARRGAIWNMTSWALFIAVGSFFSYNTIMQNRTWKNEKVFYESLLRYVPDSYVAHNNMGNIYADEGKIDLAISEYEKALEIIPHYMASHLNLARRYLALGEREKAVGTCERASAYFPTLAEPRYQLAIIYEYNGKNVRYGPGFERGKAIEEYKKAIELEPNYFWPHLNLAVVYEFDENGQRYTDLVQMGLAKKEYEKALQIDPYNQMARKNLSILLKNINQR